ncbi:MAG: FAD-dependent monooxygenase [Pseudonocardia sp.]|nr:FAD-dependent monooxygenase [Pseudonocardia sp.]
MRAEEGSGRMDVVIVGAGPTGLTLACALTAHGVAVRVVDRATGPSHTSRANILHARGVEVLARVGAVDGLREQALAPIGMKMHAHGRVLATMRFAPDPSESVQALFVSQAAIESALRCRLSRLGVEVEWDTPVTAAEQDAGGVTVTLGFDTSVRADWLVGCDGAHSTVRDLAGIGFPGVPVVERFLLADVHADWNRDRSTSASWFHPDGLLLAMPMRGAEGSPEDLWRLMADVPADDEHLDPGQIVARFERLLPERAGQDHVRIRDAVWTSVFRVQRRLADDYRSGRILLAGDAAHIHSPIGGQGMNTGIGDAENLAWKLALVVHGRASEALLDTYTAERRPLAVEVLRSTTMNTRILVGTGPVARFLRDRVFVPLLNQPGVQRRATRTASQLWATYRAGPLGGRGRAPRPGDRIPDRPCTRHDGTPTRLHAELNPLWVLLAPRGHDTDLEATDAVARKHLGADVIALHAHTALDRILLVRPDGHLAWRGRDPADLQRSLSRVLLGQRK